MTDKPYRKKTYQYIFMWYEAKISRMREEGRERREEKREPE